jgi:1-acyl-sn-glycerol-3-phosphate acyltransferase
MKRPKAELDNQEQIEKMYKYYGNAKKSRFARATRFILEKLINPQVSYLEGAKETLEQYQGRLVVAINHIDNLDPPVLAAVTARIPRLEYPAVEHATIPAKASLFNTPVIGSIVTKLGALPTFRQKDKDPGGLRKIANSAMMEINKNKLRDNPYGTVFIFPEGTRNKDDPGNVKELKPGVVELLKIDNPESEKYDPTIGVLPVGIAYRGLLKFRRPEVVVGNIITPEANLTEEALLLDIRGGMQECVDQANNSLLPLAQVA